MSDKSPLREIVATLDAPVAWRRVFPDGTYCVHHGKPRESDWSDKEKWTVEPLFSRSAVDARREDTE